VAAVVVHLVVSRLVKLPAASGLAARADTAGGGDTPGYRIPVIKLPPDGDCVDEDSRKAPLQLFNLAPGALQQVRRTMLKPIRRQPGAEIAVVLGGGLLDDGRTPAQATALRARAALELARTRPQLKVIVLSGKGAPGRLLKTTEAAAMRRVLRQHGIRRKQILLEDESLDTIGNAVLVAARHLHGLSPRRLYLITSPFHMERALFMFRHVLGGAWEVIGYPCAVAADDAGRAAGEPGGMAWAREFFAGIEPGDLAAVIARLFEYGKPYYRTLRRLRRVARRLEKRSRG